MACTILSAAIFMVNVTLAVVLRTIYSVASNGIGELYQGSCDKVQSYSSWLHLGINILSTLLLRASNLCMQLLSAPTRKELDQAHRAGQWMDIGVPSLRNLRRISKRRVATWAVLGISSLLFHFLSVTRTHVSSFPNTLARYNSAVFATIANNTYLWSVVNSKFLDGAPFNVNDTVANLQLRLNDSYTTMNHDRTLQGVGLNYSVGSISDLDQDRDNFNLVSNHSTGSLADMQAAFGNASLESSMYIKLEPLSCLLLYQELLGNKSNVLLISSAGDDSNSSLLWFGSDNFAANNDYIGSWMCANTNSFCCHFLSLGHFLGANDFEKGQNRLLAIKDWNVAGYKIDYCLATQVSLDNKCSLEYSEVIMIG